MCEEDHVWMWLNECAGQDRIGGEKTGTVRSGTDAARCSLLRVLVGKLIYLYSMNHW